MNPFDQRWREATHRACSAQPPTDDTAPFGFATRVVAHWPAPELSGWLVQKFILQMLGAMTALLLLLAAHATLTGDDRAPLQFTLEDTVGELFWIQ